MWWGAWTGGGEGSPDKARREGWRKRGTIGGYGSGMEGGINPGKGEWNSNAPCGILQLCNQQCKHN